MEDETNFKEPQPQREQSLKERGFDLIMSINKKQAEIQSLQQQLQEIGNELNNR